MQVNNSSPALVRLIEQFERLPGIGKKTAQRLAFHLLDMPREKAAEFSAAILDAREKLHRCPVCLNLTEDELCPVCSQSSRDKSIICVVETPQDVMAFERTREYNGGYHVLHGLISPMDGIGPEQLGIKELIGRVGGDEVLEIIMATNPTVEGEATAAYLAKLLKPLGVKTSRLAYGIPVGGNLEYADEVTLFRALEGRQEI